MARVVGTTYISVKWPLERDDWLITLWKEGRTIVEIGESMGVTKNAVVGRARRLGAKGLLTPRESPIKSGSGIYADAKARSRARRIAGRPLRSGQNLQPLPASADNLSPLPSVAAQPRNVPRETPMPFARVVTCVFPIGEPKKKGFRWCADDAKRGSPYCPRHHSICYVRVGTIRANYDAA